MELILPYSLGIRTISRDKASQIWENCPLWALHLRLGNPLVGYLALGLWYLGLAGAVPHGKHLTAGPQGSPDGAKPAEGLGSTCC